MKQGSKDAMKEVKDLSTCVFRDWLIKHADNYKLEDMIEEYTIAMKREEGLRSLVDILIAKVSCECNGGELALRVCRWIQTGTGY